MTELGKRLKEAREAKDISLDDLQTITKIQKRYLIGIEQGNFAIMPGKFYVRAFIKQYAEAVDLNPEEIFDLYKEEVPNIVNADLPELSRVQTRKSIPSDNSKVRDMIPKILIVAFLLGVAALIYYVFMIYADDDRNESVNNGNEAVNYDTDKLDKKLEDKTENNSAEGKKDNDATDVDSSTDLDQETEIVEEVETPKQEVTVVSTNGRNTVYELKNSDRFELKLVSTGATWVNMKNDKGFSFFQGTLKKGETESQTVDYSKESEAVLIIGRSLDTEIYINDQKIEYAVAPTDEVTQNIVIRFIPKEE
ncbi:helix-turn-helix domain-containing protein [Bacillus sp. CGMCC 1.16607]|uniref:helix-turn-helix domain-containing protein n=1 Tax=Bacillus sp. CGMCC 1.16607 TaxID=3351842 RepID=UPI00363A84AC